MMVRGERGACGLDLGGFEVHVDHDHIGTLLGEPEA
jgi:hypothetical protein